MRILLMALNLCVCLVASAADTIAYHGQLTKANGSGFSNPLPLTMTFALYAEATGGTPLWGRVVPVKVEADGTFFAELSDSSSSALTGCRETALKEALQGMTSVYVGLTPFGSTEMKPRTLLPAQPRALVARTAKTVESVKAGELKAECVTLSSGTLKDVTAPKIVAKTAVKMNPSGDLTLEAKTALKLTGAVSDCKAASNEVAGDRMAKGCGSILWYQSTGSRGDQWGSIVYPRGATLRRDGNLSRSQYFGKEL